MSKRPSPVDQRGPGRCPVCRSPVAPDPVAPDKDCRPFCCERCKMVDLGRWFRGDYVIAGEDAIEMDPEQFEEGLRELMRRSHADSDIQADDMGGDPEPEA